MTEQEEQFRRAVMLVWESGNASTSFIQRRPVIRCTLPDGRDPACELVRQGHATDWPRYSGGHYRGCGE
ncbi:MAG: hypothetical protein LCH61_12055 [Proteobacteria bacterium]|nr:hypothetical protein [Pseudomonadota bacterium]